MATVSGFGKYNCKKKKIMKKAFYLLIAAATLMTVASCVKDQFESIRPESSVGQTEFTVSLAPGTRTDLNEESKTVWTEGDTLWVTNGVGVDKIGVSEDAWGTQEFSIKTDKATPTVDNPTVYIVYPYDSGSRITEDGKVVVKVPGVQDGTFASANICAGESEGQTVALRNVTAVMKVTVPAETPAPIYQLVFTAAGEGAALSGDVAVDFSGENPVITAENTSASVVTNVGGVDGAIYTAVIPGKYEAGFKLTAATIDFEHATQTRATTAANDVKINEIVDLGSIGTDLQPLAGNGSKGNPFQIENLAHLIALSAAVDNNYEDVKGFEGQYFKVMNDLSGVTTPIGTGEYPFCGDFDGNNKIVTVDISGNDGFSGFFAYISNGACIHDLVVDGSVTNTGDYVGGVVGYSQCDKEGARATVKNVVNMATVKGGMYVGGLIGWSNYTDFINNVNTGAVTGVECAGGTAGYLYYSNVNGDVNTGAIKTTSTVASRVYISSSGALTPGDVPTYIGTGGVVGAMQNSSVTGAENSGSVYGYFKVGGITGVLYWSSATDCVNKGEVEATAAYTYNIASQMGLGYGSIVGGIVGWGYANANVTRCINRGTIYGRGGHGGIAGFFSNTNNSSSIFRITECVNYGGVYSDKVYSGGVAGLNAGTGGILGTAASYRGYVVYVTDCVNKGDVTSDKKTVGGIVGNVIQGQNGAASTTLGNPTIDGCVNEGMVSGTFWIGGILGYSFSRFITCPIIRNCANHGMVLGTRKDADNGVVVGGIFGANGAHNGSYKTNSNGHVKVYNSYNDGAVLYSSASYVKPYAGGIAGNLDCYSYVQNCFNVGVVGTETGVAPAAGASAFLGELAGRQAGNYVHYCYYPLNGSVKQPVGTNGTVARTDTVCSFDDDGTLSTVVTANKIPCDNLLQVLNEWQNYYVTTGYYNWMIGPGGYPIHDGTKD